MLSFSEIQKEFDASLAGITAYRSMIKEYLQCKILEFVYRGPFKYRLVFLGGTKLRLLNNFRRFSEDLDFDLSGVYDSNDHLTLCEYPVKEFHNQNINAEIDQDKKIREFDVQTRYINFPTILELAGLKDLPGRKFFIKIDAQKHDFGSYSYLEETHLLKFEISIQL